MWSYNYDYLCHGMHGYKYIDKIKIKNGKYRYVYEEPQKKESIGRNDDQSGIKGSGAIIRPFSLLRAMTGLKVVDLKSGKHIQESSELLEKENKKANEDSFDDIITTEEIANNFKQYLYDIYDFNNLDRDKTLKTDIKSMKKQLSLYYKTFRISSFDGKTDDEIINLYLLMWMKQYGYDPTNVNLSVFVQNLGYVDETSIFDDSNVKTLKDLKRTKGDINDDLDMEYVNYENLDQMALSPYNQGDYPKEAAMGYTTNCAYCTLAYELRQRGYDVEASAASWNTYNTEDVIESWYTDSSGNPSEFATLRVLGSDYAKKQIMSDVDSNGEARGQFVVRWLGGGGHSMVYEVVNGDVIIRDCQTNTKYTLSQWCSLYSSYVTSANFLRTDDKEISDSALVGVRNRR